MQQITLTGRMILDMALFSGLVVDEKLIDDTLMETEYELSCNMDGIEIGSEDEPGKTEKYTHAIWDAEHPEEGVMPLGEKMKA